MHATPSDLDALISEMNKLGGNLQFPGYYAATLEICAALEPNMVVNDDRARARWRIDLASVRMWADPSRGALYGVTGRTEVLNRLHDTSLKWWRGPSKSAVRPLPFIKSEALRRIAERDFLSASAAAMAEESKSALILCGSVVEAVLLDILEREPAKTTVAVGNLPNAKRFGGVPSSWTFESLIEACGPNGLSALSQKTLEVSHTVRQWRNFVHPDRERTELASNPLRASDAQIAAAFTQRILEDAEAWSGAHP